MLRPTLLFVSLSSLLLSGCALTSTAPPSPVTASAIQGKLYGGQQIISGAHVYLMAASTSGYGAASTSLLSASLTGLSDSVGAYVLTQSDGSFSISNDYTCTPGTQVYLYGSGGNAGGGANSQIGLLAALGVCPTAQNLAVTVPYISVNEATTVAAAYALAGFTVDPTHIGSSGTTLAQQGIANAFANVTNLVDLNTGATRTANLSKNAVVPTSTINMLANMLAACINSSDTPTFANCGTLFANAAQGTTVPTDTATAAINLAHHPGASTTTLSALYGLVSSTAPFQPSLSPAPTDLTLSLGYTGEGLVVQGVDIDSAGNIWTAAPTVGSQVRRYSPLGALTLGPIIDSSLNYPNAVAIDSRNNVWVSNGNAGVVEISSAGAVISPAGGYLPTLYSLAIAVDGLDGVWASPDGMDIAHITNSSGTYVASTYTANTGTINGFSIAIDSSENAWFVGHLMTTIDEVSQTNTITPTSLGLNAGYQQGVAFDSANNLWSGSLEVASIQKSSVANGTISYSGGGLSDPDYLAVDGLGNVWCSNGRNAQNVSVFANTGAILSPYGFKNAYIMNNLNGAGYVGNTSEISIDGSGNVWVTSANGYLSEFIGAAAPVVTPRSAAVKTNMIGQRP